MKGAIRQPLQVARTRKMYLLTLWHRARITENKDIAIHACSYRGMFSHTKSGGHNVRGGPKAQNVNLSHAIIRAKIKSGWSKPLITAAAHSDALGILSIEKHFRYVRRKKRANNGSEDTIQTCSVNCMLPHCKFDPKKQRVMINHITIEKNTIATKDMPLTVQSLVAMISTGLWSLSQKATLFGASTSIA